MIDVRIDDGVALLTLNNPPLNLVTVALTAELGASLDRLARDQSVRVLVVTGAGNRAFCAGSDIKEFETYMEPGAVVERKLRTENQVYSSLDRFPAPTIAALDGPAIGGGLELAVCCDLIVVAEGVVLSMPEVGLGVIPGSGGTARIARRIGEGRAKEMMFLGEPLDAETALAWGLVNRIAPPGRALTCALELSSRLAALPGKALRLCKEAIDLALDANLQDAIDGTLLLSDEVFTTEDARVGVRAFLAREEPKFRHR
jgi:enoyl-CoA hydratase/carnithine racemase